MIRQRPLIPFPLRHCVAGTYYGKAQPTRQYASKLTYRFFSTSFLDVGETQKYKDLEASMYCTYVKIYIL